MLKRFLNSALIGLSVGSLTYLTVLAIIGTSTITFKNIISIWIMSILIGWLSMIFDIEWNMPLEILIHLLVTAGLVITMTIYNGWWSIIQEHLAFNILGFLLIYIAVWIGLYVVQVIDMKRLNTQIRKRKNNG